MVLESCTVSPGFGCPEHPNMPPPEVEDELVEELELLLVLLEDEELEELEVELLDDVELDELLDEEELLELLDEVELLELEPLGIEHSLTPPAIRPPKVVALQTKLPLSTLKKNWSARPKATLVLAATEQVWFSLQMVT
jgi:hypothetical protein